MSFCGLCGDLSLHAYRAFGVSTWISCREVRLEKGFVPLIPPSPKTPSPEMLVEISRCRDVMKRLFQGNK